MQTRESSTLSEYDYPFFKISLSFFGRLSSWEQLLKNIVWTTLHYFGIKHAQRNHTHTSTIKTTTKKKRVILLTPFLSINMCESRIINMHVQCITTEPLRICLLQLIQKGVLQCLLLPSRPRSSVLSHPISILLKCI